MPSVLGAVKTEHRRLDLGCEFKGVFRHGRARGIHQASVKSNARLEVGIMRRIKPHRAPAPAKADNAEPVRIASLGLGPIDRRVEIGKKLMIGLAVDQGNQLLKGP